ncbi:6-hydroxynicotinate 3-monooxygenase [Lasiodiplodia theobromae]|uniref:6-hydroxynicotinate 3-monooxygenase n=1 Tax=Lasiodiplodia theobromae TaxID=45133 RepID=A0A5N5DSH2_9PEZI|nr:6-hydroxynicotinate 3-monooxygenase [Lasiodiplodia theobromae]
MASTTHTDDTLHVAIAGAGIAGLAAAVALTRNFGSRVDVQLYDKATALREIGASIALGPNGLRTLEKLGVENALDDDVAFRGPSGLPMIYRHWKTNEIVSFDEFVNVPERRHQTARFARAHLHQSLLEHVDPARIYLGKKIVSVKEEAGDEGPLVLKFADGSETKADFVVGADGINSGVRKFFVPEQKLGWTTQVAYRAVFDASLVEGTPDLPEDSTHWWGPTGSFFASRLGKGQFTTVGIISLDPSDPKNAAIVDNARWDNLADINFVRELYKDWHPLIRTLFARTPASSIRVYPNLAITAPLPAHTFLGGRAVLIGDAAHPHGGAFATGGSLALDDAYALAQALRAVWPSPSGTDATAAGGGSGKPAKDRLAQATRIYEKARKPHTTRLLNVVHALTEKSRERLRRSDGGVETDEELRKRMKARAETSWLHEHDVDEAVRRAVEAELGAVGGAGSVEARL